MSCHGGRDWERDLVKQRSPGLWRERGMVGGKGRERERWWERKRERERSSAHPSLSRDLGRPLSPASSAQILLSASFAISTFAQVRSGCPTARTKSQVNLGARHYSGLRGRTRHSTAGSERVGRPDTVTTRICDQHQAKAAWTGAGSSLVEEEAARACLVL